jgi:hypothetical protein
LTWETLWAVGRYDLRLTDEEFWHMVPRQFDALVRRDRERQLREEFAAGIICQTVASLAGVKMPYTNFMPSWKRAVEPETDWRELLAKTQVLHAAYGGVQ